MVDVVYRVSVEGATQLRADLRRFAPDLARDLQRTLAGQSSTVASAAKSLIPAAAPLSGWSRAWQGDRLRWSPSAAVTGIAGTTARGRRTADGYTIVVAVVQRNPAGVVYEVAGRRSTSMFSTQLDRRHGRASRALWRAVEAKQAQVAAAVAAAVARAEKQLDARIRGGAL